MSNPHELTGLKKTVDTYEREVADNNEIYQKAPNIQNAAHMLNSCVKLLEAYRRYVIELERYVPK